MELEEIKTLWSEMSDQLESQKKLTNKLIMEMTQDKYRNKIDKIFTYEFIGAIICFIAGIILSLNFYKLDTWYLITCGILIVLYLLIVPAIVLKSIKKMRGINIVNNNYKQTLIEYAKNRRSFLLIQRLGIYLNFLLLFISIPVIVKLSDNKDIFIEHSNSMYWYISVMVLFLIFFSRWGYRGYKKMTNSAENLLKELKD